MDITTQCLFCGSDNFEVITEHGDKFTTEKSNMCMNCGLVFLSPRMSDEELTEYYLSDTFSSDFRDEIVPSEEKMAKDLDRASRRWEVIREVVDEGGKALDIGGSWGPFAQAVRGYMDPYIIDPSSGYVDYARDSGINAIKGIFPENMPKEKFDLVTIFHVLEHVPHPIEFLISARDYMQDDGVFVLEYPDLSKAVQRPALLSTYFQRSHLYDFSLANLYHILNKVGFFINGIAMYDAFPEDKNIMLICSKADPVDEMEFVPKFATDLLEEVRAKLQEIK